MHPPARKVQQNGHKRHAAILSLESSENSINSINRFSHSQLQYKLCGINDYYYVTFLIHSHEELTVVISRATKSQ